MYVNISKYHGFSLPDALIAMLLFSIGVTGLMRYYQTSVFQFHYLSERHKTWQLATQLLDTYPDYPANGLDNWHYSVNKLNQFGACSYIEVNVKSPTNIMAKLGRVICD